MHTAVLIHTCRCGDQAYLIYNLCALYAFVCLCRYKRGDPQFLLDLDECVALDQVPPYLGGSSKEAWAYGDGGDIPKGAADLLYTRYVGQRESTSS